MDVRAIHEAIQRRDVKMLNTLISLQANINEVIDELSPLMYAAKENSHTSIIKVLLDANAAPQGCGTSQPPPLTLATSHGSTAVMQALIDAHADVDSRHHDPLLPTALFHAVEMGSEEKVRLLLTNKAALVAINQNYDTALDIAKRKGHQDITKLLLDAKATPGEMWDHMHDACTKGCADEVMALLDSGYPLHLQDKRGQYPLLLSTKHGHTVISRMLLDARAKLDFWPTNENYSTPLVNCIRRGDLSLAKSLIDANADVNFCVRTSPSYWAAVRNDVVAMKMLIDAKADVEKSMEFAAQLNCPEVVVLLLDAKADVNGGETTPLMRAAAAGFEKSVNILLDARASLDKRDKQHLTPLMHAIKGNHGNIVKILLDVNQDMDVPYDALRLATEENNIAIMKILIEAKSALETSNTLSRSPLLVAIEKQSLPAMRLLLEAKAAIDVPGTKYRDNLLFGALKSVTSSKFDVLGVLLEAEPSLVSHQCISGYLVNTYLVFSHSFLQFLLERHASVDGVTVEGVPILYRAVSQHRPQVVKMMIDAKANVNVRGPEWYDTPLILASRRRYRDTVPMLLEAKATLNVTDRNGYTALRHAVDVLHYTRNQYPVDASIVQMLVDAKAPLEYDALRAVVRGSESAVVKILVDAKANLRVRDGQGETLLMLAVGKGSTSIVDILLTADPSLFHERDSYGRTALMRALSEPPRWQYPQVVEMLQDYENTMARGATETDEEPTAKRLKKND